MSSEPLDVRFCEAALDALKGLRGEFTVQFFERQGWRLDGERPVTKAAMWERIRDWIHADARSCAELWEFVDEARLWGHQRIFLFDVDGDYARDLPAEVARAAGSLYGTPRYQWDASGPFVAVVRHSEGRLVFKLIADRPYSRVMGGRVERFIERSTNFFFVDLESRHAELRLQELPTGAERDLGDERDRLLAEIGKYLDLTKFRLLKLDRIMGVLLRNKVYIVDAVRFRLSERAPRADASGLVAFVDRLFQRQDPVELNLHWNCDQQLVAGRPLHFRLSAHTDDTSIAGTADPDRVRELLGTLVSIARRRSDVGPPPTTAMDGMVDALLKETADRPAAQAVVLSAGAIAASVIWTLLGGFGELIVDWLKETLIPVDVWSVAKILLEAAFLVSYYGWRRVMRGLRALGVLSSLELWKAIRDARRRQKAVAARGAESAG